MQFQKQFSLSRRCSYQSLICKFLTLRDSKGLIVFKDKALPYLTSFYVQDKCSKLSLVFVEYKPEFAHKIQKLICQHIKIQEEPHLKIELVNLKTEYFMKNYANKLNLSTIKKLNISDIKISSIDFLPKLQLPSLRDLNLSDNMISNLSPLRKTYFKMLQQLKIEDNLIQEYNPLSQLLCPQLRLKIQHPSRQLIRPSTYSPFIKMMGEYVNFHMWGNGILEDHNVSIVYQQLQEKYMST